MDPWFSWIFAANREMLLKYSESVKLIVLFSQPEGPQSQTIFLWEVDNRSLVTCAISFWRVFKWYWASCTVRLPRSRYHVKQLIKNMKTCTYLVTPICLLPQKKIQHPRIFGDRVVLSVYSVHAYGLLYLYSSQEGSFDLFEGIGILNNIRKTHLTYPRIQALYTPIQTYSSW